MKRPRNIDYAKTGRLRNLKRALNEKRHSSRRFCIARADERLPNRRLASTNDGGPAVVTILGLSVIAMSAVFSKFKLVRWGWLSGTISILIGAVILATFLALFNCLTPSGRVTVAGAWWR